MKSVIARLFPVRRSTATPPASPPLRLAVLEDRTVPTVDVFNKPLVDTVIHGGDTVRIADTVIQSSTNVGRVARLEFAAADNTSLSGLQSARVQIDWNNDGYPDTDVGPAVIDVDAGVLTAKIPLGVRPLFGGSRQAHILVSGSFASDAPALSDEFGLEILSVRTVSLKGYLQPADHQTFAGVPYTLQVVRPVVQIRQLNLGSPENALPKQTIRLMAWEAYSTGDKSIIEAVPVSTLNGNFISFAKLEVWVDTDGDLVPDTVVGTAYSPSGYRSLIKLGSGVMIGGSPVRFELRGTLLTWPATGLVSVEFDRAHIDDLRVEETDHDIMDGVIINGIGLGDIALATAAPKIFNVLPSTVVPQP